MQINPEHLRRLKHELRTPLNHILGYSDLLLETATDSGDAATADVAKDIHATGQQLARLLEKSFTSPSGEMDDSQMDTLRDNIRPVVQQILKNLSSPCPQPKLDSHVADLHRIRRAADQLMILVESLRIPISE